MTAKTILTFQDKPFTSDIEYTFKSDTDTKIILAQNYQEARRKLNKLTGNKIGYVLVQRLL